MSAAPRGRRPQAASEDAITRGSALVTSERTDEEVARAQRALASIAVSHPKLTCPEQREAELEEVMRALGILRFVGQTKTRRRKPAPCDGFTGTVTGYRMHLRVYHTPCAPCVEARHEELRARWEALGVNAESEVVEPV